MCNLVSRTLCVFYLGALLAANVPEGHAFPVFLQLTDNGGNYFPAISGSNVVWHRLDDSSAEIYLWDGSTTTRITNDSYDDVYPAISGSNVVWMRCDYEGGMSCLDGYGDWEIYHWDGATVTQVTNNSVDDKDPAISGSNVVWRARNGGHLALYHWDGATTTQITTGSVGPPAISGSNVVWSNHDGNDAEIYLWDGSFPVVVTQISDNSDWDLNPAISGSKVVWDHCDDPLCGNGDVHVYLWEAGTTTRIDSRDDGEWERRPAISGSRVVWEERVGDSYELYLWDGSSASQITDNDFNERRPAISGSTVVFDRCGEIYLIRALIPLPALSIVGLIVTAGLLGLAGWRSLRG